MNYSIKRKTLCLAVLFLALPGPRTWAQDLDSLLTISAYSKESDLQKQLNRVTQVASGKALTTRETPGILSVVTAEEIQQAGARDLTDILRLIPGFDIAQDLAFVTGVSMRGNWAHEGKVLILLNGFQMNELLYQNNALINHFPVDFIDRIEIIRGPGSALYGGSAEYGVINIVTRPASSLDGLVVTGTAGFHKEATGRTNTGIMLAQHNDQFSWDASAYLGKGILSDQPYQDLYNDNDVQDLASTSVSDPMNLSLGLTYKNLSVRSMYDKLDIKDPSIHTWFKQFFTTAKYDWKVSPRLLITPQWMYSQQEPWAQRYMGGSDEYLFLVKVRRQLGSLNFNYDINRKFNLDAGTVYFRDLAEDGLKEEHFNGSNSLSINNYAIYAQGLLKHRLANVTFGFRYEKNSRTDGAFVPRLALTKKIENFHFKALYSQAFRTPSVENINIAKDGTIKPEKADAIELELGYQFTPEMLLVINGFKLSNKNAIVYAYEELGDDFIDYYQNYDKTGTSGIEAVYSIHMKRWYGRLTYAYARASSKNTVDTYVVPQTANQYIGMLAHKLTVSTTFTLTEGLTVNSSLIVGGKRYAYQSLDDEDAPAVSELPAYALANLFVQYRVPSPGLMIGAGVYDLFNERPAIPQAYNGDYAPLPGRSREYIVKLSYQLNFAKNEK